MNNDELLSKLTGKITRILVGLGLVLAIIGCAPHITAGGNLSQYASAALLNVATEFIGLGVAVFLLENRLGQVRAKLAQTLETEAKQEALRVELGSAMHNIAFRASEQLRARGWLQNGLLRGANLHGADLHEADLSYADLRGVRLDWANLKEVNLQEANLEGADLGGSDFSRMSSTSARAATLWYANLEGAKLGRANLEGVNLGGANLKGADLTAANCGGVLLDPTPIFDRNTIMPDGTHWTEGRSLSIPLILFHT